MLARALRRVRTNSRAPPRPADAPARRPQEAAAVARGAVALPRLPARRPPLPLGRPERRALERCLEAVDAQRVRASARRARPAHGRAHVLVVGRECARQDRAAVRGGAEADRGQGRADADAGTVRFLLSSLAVACLFSGHLHCFRACTRVRRVDCIVRVQAQLALRQGKNSSYPRCPGAQHWRVGSIVVPKRCCSRPAAPTSSFQSLGQPKQHQSPAPTAAARGSHCSFLRTQQQDGEPRRVGHPRVAD